MICDGALPEFLAFKANAAQNAVFAAHKLDVDALEHSMKLLTLCSLAAQATDKVRLTYSDTCTQHFVFVQYSPNFYVSLVDYLHTDALYM